MSWFMNLFLSFRGRLSRRGFWTGLGVLVLPGLAAHLLSKNYAPGDAPFWLLGVTFLLLRLQAPLYVKRLHDRGKSGKPFGLWCLATGIFALGAPWFPAIFEGQSLGVLVLISLLLCAYFLVFMWCFIQAGFLGPRPEGTRFEGESHGVLLRGSLECAAAWILGAGLALLSGSDSEDLAAHIASRIKLEVPAQIGRLTDGEEGHLDLSLRLLELDGAESLSSSLTRAFSRFELLLSRQAEAETVLAAVKRLMEQRAEGRSPISWVRGSSRWDIRQQETFELRPFVAGRSRTLLLRGQSPKQADAARLVKSLVEQPGIAWAGLEGGSQLQLSVFVDPDRADAFGLDLLGLDASLRELLVHSGTEISAEELGNLALNGEPLFLRDIAQVQTTQAPDSTQIPQHELGVIHLLLSPDTTWSTLAEVIRGELVEHSFDADSPLVDEVTPQSYLRLSADTAPGVTWDQLRQQARVWLQVFASHEPDVSEILLRTTGRPGNEQPGLGILVILQGLPGSMSSTSAALLAELNSPLIGNLRVDQGSTAGSRTDHTLVVYGEDLEQLNELGDLLWNEFAAGPEITVVELSTPGRGAPELVIEFDREKLLALGLAQAELSATVDLELARDSAVSRFNSGLSPIERLGDMAIDLGDFRLRLEDVARAELQESSARVPYFGTRRALEVRLALSPPSSPASVDARVQELIDAMDRPESLTLRPPGAPSSSKD